MPKALVDVHFGAEFGRIDILVNCAGGSRNQVDSQNGPMTTSSARLTLNFGAVWHLSRAAAKPMIEQGKGAIVNISSGASLLAMPQAAPYGAAKAASQQPDRIYGGCVVAQGCTSQCDRRRCCSRCDVDGRRRTLWTRPEGYCDDQRLRSTG